jgi:hypothetical protein
LSHDLLQRNRIIFFVFFERAIIVFYFYCKLINIAFYQILLYYLKLIFMFIWFLLLIYYQSVPIFQCILSSTVKIFYNLRPFLRSFIFFYTFQKLNVFIRPPRTLFEVRIEITIPMLSTLLCISKDFIVSIIQKVKLLRNHFPVFRILRFSLKLFLVN